MRIVALLVCLLAFAPQGGAAALVTPDPSHDAVLTQNSLMVPIDSIDIVGFSSVQAGPNLRGASIEVYDLSRRGLEDRLFVQSDHAYRTYGYVEVYDALLLNLIAVQVDEGEFRYAAFLLQPGEIDEIPVEFSVDERASALAWRIVPPFRGEPDLRFAYAGMHGCDDDETCQPALPRVQAFDMAPNDLAMPIVELVPPMWWEDVLAEDDGTVPESPVSLAALANAV